MITFDDQLELLRLIGESLKKRIECFVIGGGAMMFYGAKEETKDVDLVFMDKKDLLKVREALYDLGFEERKRVITIFKRYEEAENKPIMMVGKNEDRFDLFCKEIITFKMSDSIFERVKETHEFGNLIIKIVSPEDIILLKCATEREKDRYDALSLMEKFDINWDIIIGESVHQTEIGAYVFPVFLFDFLLELKEDLKADVPKKVLDKIRSISEKMLVDYLKKRKK